MSTRPVGPSNELVSKGGRVRPKPPEEPPNDDVLDRMSTGHLVVVFLVCAVGATASAAVAVSALLELARLTH